MEINQDLPKLAGAEFIRTATRNYIAIKKPDGYEDDYQMAMIMENDIKGLLAIENRSIDGKDYLYYDISSLQPIRRMYEHKGLSGEDIKNTIRNVYKALKEADDYMLDISNIIISPSYIYTDPDDKSIYMMFYPYRDDKEINGMLELAEFFLERIERSDADAALLSYKFYKTVRKENYVISDIEAVIDDGFGIPEPQADKQNSSSYEDRKETFSASETINICKRDPGKSKEKDKIPYVFIAIALAVAALICFLVLSGVIPGVGQRVEEKIVAAALAVSFLAASIVCTVNHLKTDKSPKADLSGHLEADRGQGILMKTAVVEKKVNKEDPDGNVNQTAKAAVTVYSKEEGCDFDSFFSDLPPKGTSPAADSEADISNAGIAFGKTVFLSDDNEKPENILEDKKGREYKIDHFPFLIGKMSDSADLVLNDRTVSRIHARITTENDHYFIQDCNSTNGTYLNGMELKGEEMAMLTKNDEIGIGHVKLNYR